MKRALIWTLAFAFLAPATWAGDNGWPEDTAQIEALVASAVGPIPYDRVKIRRHSDSIEVSIKLKNMSRQFRTLVREQTEDDVFLAAPVIELFEPSLDGIVSFNLLPDADLLDYYFGFAVFNFGKKIKLPATITVTSENGEEFTNTKKKFKMRRNKLLLRFLERGVSGGGLHKLVVSVGPQRQVAYFCVDCL